MRYRNLSFLVGLACTGACTSGAGNRAESAGSQSATRHAGVVQSSPEPPEPNPASKVVETKPDQPASAKAPEAKEPAREAGTEEKSRTIEVVEEKHENGEFKRRAEGYKDADGEFVPHGLTTTWYETGVKWAETTFRDGNKHGVQRKWYNTGAEWSVTEFDDGVENGLWTAYHPNGEKAREFRIDHGVWDGPFVEYHTNGRKSSEVTFVKGLRQGVMTVYDQEGKAAFKTDYIDGVEQP